MDKRIILWDFSPKQEIDMPGAVTILKFAELQSQLTASSKQQAAAPKFKCPSGHYQLRTSAAKPIRLSDDLYQFY